jgi:hypothetical protein
VKGCLTLLFVVVAGLGAPSQASAQSEGSFAVGGGVTTRMAGDRDVHGHINPSLLWRFGQGKPGWGFHWGLNWFATDLERSIGGDSVELGELKVRPFMAGYGYTYKVGRASIIATALAGYAFGSIKMTPVAVDAYRDRLGARTISAESSNTFTAKPEIGVWYDINKKFGLNVSIGYVIARPHVTVHSSLGEDRRDVRADQFILKAGIVYSIF